MRDARGQNAGLAGAGAGQHQYRAVKRFDRFALLGIEPVQIGRLRGGLGARSDAARLRLRRGGGRR